MCSGSPGELILAASCRNKEGFPHSFLPLQSRKLWFDAQQPANHLTASCMCDLLIDVATASSTSYKSLFHHAPHIGQCKSTTAITWLAHAFTKTHFVWRACTGPAWVAVIRDGGSYCRISSKVKNTSWAWLLGAKKARLILSCHCRLLGGSMPNNQQTSWQRAAIVMH